MDLTQEDIESLRRLLDQIREIGEDFAHVFANRMIAQGPKSRRIAVTSGQNGGELILSNLAASVALLDEAERESANLTFDVGEAQISETIDFNLKVECFQWAAERCLGGAFTPEVKAAHRKLALITAQIARKRKEAAGVR